MKDIYKIVLGSIVAFILVVCLDILVGTWSERMYYRSKFGIYHRQIYCLHESKDDIMILGSSRAAHHYVPQIFVDSLGLSCYNAGSDGMCIYYHYAILASRIFRGAPPKMVVLEVYDSDAEVSYESVFSLDAALDRLAPHYGEIPEVDSLFYFDGWKGRLKLLSRTYRYNSKLVQIIKCNYVPWPEDKGYEALYGRMDLKDSSYFDVIDEKNKPNIEKRKLEYMLRFIQMCKNNNIDLLLCYSPYYNKKQGEAVEMIKNIAAQNNVPFLDFCEDLRFQNAEFFKDPSHMNDIGAKEYTKVVAHYICDSNN